MSLADPGSQFTRKWLTTYYVMTICAVPASSHVSGVL